MNKLPERIGYFYALIFLTPGILWSHRHDFANTDCTWGEYFMSCARIYRGLWRNRP